MGPPKSLGRHCSVQETYGTGESRTGWQSYSKTWTYNAGGNRATYNGSTWTYNASNQLTSAPTWGETYTYDRKGNMATKVASSQTTTYTSNWEQQLKSVAYPGGGSTNFVWDYDGNRRRASGIGETDRYFVYDGGGVLAEYATSGGALLTAYTRGATGNVGEHQGSADYTYHTDQLGNTRFLTDSTLAVVRKYTQDAFGIETASSGTPQTPHRYVGAQGYYLHGSPGFLTLGIRQYDPRLGRFTSRDPSGPVDGPNVYVYTNSNPVNGRDPGGRSVAEANLDGPRCWPIKYQQEKGFDTEVMERWGPVKEVISARKSPFGILCSVKTDKLRWLRITHWRRVTTTWRCERPPHIRTTEQVLTDIEDLIISSEEKVCTFSVTPGSIPITRDVPPDFLAPAFVGWVQNWDGTQYGDPSAPPAFSPERICRDAYSSMMPCGR